MCSKSLLQFVASLSNHYVGKTVEFTPHQVEIKDFKDPKHVLATKIVENIAKFYKFNNVGSSPFPSVVIAHSNGLRKLWYERFGHLNFGNNYVIKRW